MFKQYSRLVGAQPNGLAAAHVPSEGELSIYGNFELRIFICEGTNDAFSLVSKHIKQHMMAASPPLSPVVATPLAHRKRRHSEMTRDVIDLTGEADNDEVPAMKKAANGVHDTSGSNGVNGERNLEDEGAEDEEDDKSLVEDILDTAELDPYRADGMFILRKSG